MFCVLTSSLSCLLACFLAFLIFSIFHFFSFSMFHFLFIDNSSMLGCSVGSFIFNNLLMHIYIFAKVKFASYYKGSLPVCQYKHILALCTFSDGFIHGSCVNSHDDGVSSLMDSFNQLVVDKQTKCGTVVQQD